MRKYGQKGFFAQFTWNENIKMINISKLVQMQCWI